MPQSHVSVGIESDINYIGEANLEAQALPCNSRSAHKFKASVGIEDQQLEIKPSFEAKLHVAIHGLLLGALWAMLLLLTPRTLDILGEPPRPFSFVVGLVRITVDHFIPWVVVLGLGAWIDYWTLRRLYERANRFTASTCAFTVSSSIVGITLWTENVLLQFLSDLGQLPGS